jgi:hypothetical protein
MIPVRIGVIPCASPISSGQEGWTVYFSLYLDESGKIHRESYTALCGYFATNDEWARFSMEWDNLRVKWVIPPIHMSRIMTDRRKVQDDKNDEWTAKFKLLGDAWEAWRDKMLLEFAQIIYRANVVCVGSVVDAKAYRTTYADPKTVLPNKDCNVFLLQQALRLALDRIEIIDPRPSLQVVIDDDPETAKQYYESYVNLRSVVQSPHLREEQRAIWERVRRCVHGISFMNDSFHPPLQAADMISYIARRFKLDQDQHLDEEDSLYALLTHDTLQQPKNITGEIVFKVAENSAAAIERFNNEQNCRGI